ncbi:MAG: GNAT family N-acetyltransferase [bacterium]
MIRPATDNDSDQISVIYNHYIENTNVTFEDVPLTGEDVRLRLQSIRKVGTWLVSVHHGNVVGYAYSMPWGEREGYRTSVESTIYLDQNRIGKGFGFKLYATLLEQLRAQQHHTVVGVIGLPNPGSVALHEKLGFKKSGELKEIGTKFDKWIDVGYWQLFL